MNGEVSMKFLKSKAMMYIVLAAVAVLLIVLILPSTRLMEKDMAVDAATVILKLGDREVTKAEVQEVTQDVLSDMELSAYYYGQYLDVTDPEVIASAQDRAVSQLKADMTLRAKIAELGIDQLSDEENAQIEEDAQNRYNTALEREKSSILSGAKEGEAPEGEALEARAKENLEARGVTLDTYKQVVTDEIYDTKLREYVVKDVTVSDDEVKADYDAKVAADEEKYKENPSAWANADRNSSVLYYAPEGVRRVKQILLQFKPEDQTAINAAKEKVTEANNKVIAAEQIINDPEAAEEAKAQAKTDLEAAQAELETAQKAQQEATDTAFANLDGDADAVLDALKADPDSWDKVAEEKNEDPGMKAGAPNAEKGYAVCADMAGFDPAFVEAAMSLGSVGDVSGKTRGESYGYYIIKYVSDVEAGPVPLDSVKDSLHGTLLKEKQDGIYSETVSQWIKDAGIRENLGALKD